MDYISLVSTKLREALTFVRNNQALTYTVVAVISVLLVLGSIIYMVLVMKSIRDQTSQLGNISSYSLTQMLSDEKVKDEYTFWKKVKDMFSYKAVLEDDIARATEQRLKLSLPYDNFLHFLYLPSINIWKDTFTNEIDTTLIGEKYLTNNPYSDIELIQKRTDFFKDMGTDEYNTITDISLGALAEAEWGLFSLPLTVQFETPNKRAFLLLVNKLSMTSYVENISLTNEFMFYLWDDIKKQKQEYLTSTLQWWELPNNIRTHDQLIGYLFYQWINGDGTNELVDAETVTTTMSKVAGCVEESSEHCRYLFREKYRMLPYIAYGIGRDNADVVKWLQTVLENIPPLITIEDFSFDRKVTNKSKRATDEWYKWSVSLKIYGKDLTLWEVDEIASKLWGMCFNNQTPLSALYANSVLTRLIDQLGQQYSINEKRAKQLRQMLDYMMSIETEYEWLPNHKKVIRLFEIYRTLQEGNSCDVILEQTINTAHTSEDDQPSSEEILVQPVVDEVNSWVAFEETEPTPLLDTSPVVLSGEASPVPNSSWKEQDFVLPLPQVPVDQTSISDSQKAITPIAVPINDESVSEGSRDPVPQAVPVNP